MFKSRNRRNGKTNDQFKSMAQICPVNDEDTFSQDDFSLEADDRNTGWFFKCNKCKDSGCRGYLKK